MTAFIIVVRNTSAVITADIIINETINPSTFLPPVIFLIIENFDIEIVINITAIRNAIKTAAKSINQSI